MAPTTRRTLGTLLIALGVLAWSPFLYLVAGGQHPSIWPYLAAHLTGVLGGSALRRGAFSPEVSGASPPGRRRRLAGRLLIVLGVIAWAPYIYQHNFLRQALPIAPYLSVHLSGVLGGSALLLSVPVSRWLARR